MMHCNHCIMRSGSATEKNERDVLEFRTRSQEQQRLFLKRHSRLLPRRGSYRKNIFLCRLPLWHLHDRLLLHSTLRIRACHRIACLPTIPKRRTLLFLAERRACPNNREGEGSPWHQTTTVSAGIIDAVALLRRHPALVQRRFACIRDATVVLPVNVNHHNLKHPCQPNVPIGFCPSCGSN